MSLARQSAVFVWTDRALFVGDRSETSLHSHHALELCIALDDRGIDMSAPCLLIGILKKGNSHSP